MQQLTNKIYLLPQEYLKITPKLVLTEMFESAKTQHSTMKPGTFAAESVCDIIEQLAVYQSHEQLQQLFAEFVRPILQKNGKKSPQAAKNADRLKTQQRKAYQLLNDILESANDGCVAFVAENIGDIQELVLSSFKTTCNPTHATRLK